MKTGIFGYKGRVHYHCGTPINTWIDELGTLPKNEFFTRSASAWTARYTAGYRLYPCNYIALDLLNGNTLNAGHYTEADRKRFEQYLEAQMAKIKIENKDEAFLRERMLTMYANPLRNALRAKNEERPKNQKTAHCPFGILPPVDAVHACRLRAGEL